MLLKSKAAKTLQALLELEQSVHLFKELKSSDVQGRAEQRNKKKSQKKFTFVSDIIW